MTRPPAVRVFEQALADWLSAFTMPQALAAEMVDACADGAPWAAAIAGVAARRAGWPEPEAMAWGLAVGGLAGALEAARRSLPAGENAAAVADATEGPSGTGAAGPALPLLAADGLIAATHEAVGSLEPRHARVALTALAETFASGGPWRALPEIARDPTASRQPAAAWTALVPCALWPAAEAEPEGPWGPWERAWEARYGADAAPEAVDLRELWDHPQADTDTRALLRAAAREASAAVPAREE